MTPAWVLSPLYAMAMLGVVMFGGLFAAWPVYRACGGWGLLAQLAVELVLLLSSEWLFGWPLLGRSPRAG